MTTTTTTTEKDRDCATFARAAVFPDRIHRDVLHAYQFPALNLVDKLRQNFLAENPNAPSSAVFPKGVVVVRNTTDSNKMSTGDESLQWNGQPDINEQNASVEVIPKGVLSIRCTSECNKLFKDYEKKAFTVTTKPTAPEYASSQQQRQQKQTTEIVLCTDRVLQKDYQDPLTSSNIPLSKEEYPKHTYRAVEEVLSRQLAELLAASSAKGKDDDASSSLATSAQIQVSAAKAAECYYSGNHHTGTTKKSKQYQHQQQIKRGSGLPRGFSWLPKSVQSRIESNCIMKIATENIIIIQEQEEDDDVDSKNKRSSTNKPEIIQQAVADAMKKKTSCGGGGGSHRYQ